jgi:hypothetical protein
MSTAGSVRVFYCFDLTNGSYSLVLVVLYSGAPSTKVDSYIEFLTSLVIYHCSLLNLSSQSACSALTLITSLSSTCCNYWLISTISIGKRPKDKIQNKVIKCRYRVQGNLVRTYIGLFEVKCHNK